MGAPDTDELVGELYLVPPARFVAARDELVRKARQAGQRQLAYSLASLRRPTLSAWLVNMLTRYDRGPMEELSALGRQLRQAQLQLDAGQLRRLTAQRKPLISDLVDRARKRAVEAGLDPTEKVLSEVEATLTAALVDLAAASTVMSGRLVRPMSHSGFGPMPVVDRPSAPAQPPSPPPPRSPTAVTTDPAPAGSADTTPTPEVAAESVWRFWPVDRASEAAAQPDLATPISLDGAREQRRLPVQPKPERPGGAHSDELRRAEAALAAAESRHWQREHELADAQAALEAAQDRLQWLEQQRLEAKAAKATAERHLTAARSAQRSAVRAVAEARRALHAVEATLSSRSGPEDG